MEAEPESATPGPRDRDWVSSLSGNVSFKVSGNTADVTVDIPAPGSNEDDGSNFQLWAQDNGGGYGTALQTVASRPAAPADRKVTLTGSHSFTRSTAADASRGVAEVDRTFQVKVTWDKANGDPGSSKTSSAVRTPFNTANSDSTSGLTFS